MERDPGEDVTERRPGAASTGAGDGDSGQQQDETSGEEQSEQGSAKNADDGADAQEQAAKRDA